MVYSHTDQPCSLVSVMALLQLLHVLQSRAPRHGTHLGSVHPPHRTLCPHQLLQHRRYQNAAPLHQRLNAHFVVVVVPLENHVAVHARNCDCVWVTSCIHKVHLTHTRPFNGLFSRTTCVSRYHKGETILEFIEARDCKIWGWHWSQSARPCANSLHFTAQR